MNRKWQRAMALAVGVIAVTATATGCVTVTSSGTGSVTFTSEFEATSFNGNDEGTVVYVCPGRTSTCRSTDPYAYVYYPSTGTRAVTVSPGFSVLNTSGESVGLPAGEYTIGITEYSPGDPATATNIATETIEIFSAQQRDLTIWHKAVGRESDEASCPDGWQPSWAQWPNDETGGFVCNNESYAYYPNLPVPSPL